VVVLWHGSKDGRRRRVQGQPVQRRESPLPTQVLITPTSVVQHTPRWIGKSEETIHMAHISSVRIDTRLLLSDVFIETSGGTHPIACHGHTKGDAVRMKNLIEKHQTAYYRGNPGPS
jgi:hypothetical protein